MHPRSTFSKTPLALTVAGALLGIATGPERAQGAERGAGRNQRDQHVMVSLHEGAPHRRGGAIAGQVADAVQVVDRERTAERDQQMWQALEG